MPERDPWTTALVIMVSVIAVKIGVHNLEWALNAVGLIDTLPAHHRVR
jgi:hypothetical protein